MEGRTVAPLPPRAPAVARGALLSVLAVGLSSLGHGLAGGHLDLLTVAVLLVLAALACALLTAALPGRWTLVRLVLLLTASQVAIHLALQGRWLPGLAHPHLAGAAADQGGAGMTGMTGIGGTAGMAGMAGMAGVSGLPMAPDPGPVSGDSPAGAASALLLGLDAPMLAGHALAVLLTALAVWQGEAAAVRLLAFLSQPLHRPARPDVVEPPQLPAAAVVDWSPAGGRSAVVAYSLRRRGPPVPATGSPAAQRWSHGSPSGGVPCRRLEDRSPTGPAARSGAGPVAPRCTDRQQATGPVIREGGTRPCPDIPKGLAFP